MNRSVGSGEAGIGRLPAWAGTSDWLHQLLRYAVFAPSRHNTQPWAFEIEGPELRVYGDWQRKVPAADPDGRQLVMGCAAALANVEIAARRFGHAVSVEALAGSRTDGLLARLTIEEGCSVDAETRRLFEAIPLRRTNRFGFDARDVPPGVVPSMVRSAAAHGARLHVVDQALRPAVAELVAEACRQQWASARYRGEMAAWSRSNETTDLDGMPGYAQGLSEPASLLNRLMFRLWSGSSPEERRDRQYALHTPALLVLCTERDVAADWFAAGRAMQRVLLAATADGLSASFFSNAIEVPAIREHLRLTMGLRGWPHLLFRVGFGGEVRATPRRPPALVLRSMASVPPPHAIVAAPRHTLRV